MVRWIGAIAAFVCWAALMSSASGQDYASLPAEPARGGVAQPATRPSGDPQIKGCLVDLVDDIELPAPEAGILVFLGVEEGDQVSSEQEVARIDDREAQQAKRVAEFAYQSAGERARDDVEIRYSQAATDVAVADLLSMDDANESVAKAITEMDIRKAKLEVTRSKLGTEKAEKDQKLAALDAGTKRAELEAASLGVERRVLLSPFDGEVLEVFRDQQEWVQPGDPVLRVARLDTLQVDGYVYFDDYAQDEIVGREVTIQVDLGRGRTVEAAGRVVWVDPLASNDGRYQYRVRTEIQNRRENGRWLISPGLEATMTIHVGK
ncbi:MAG: HlyD family secretion protein [Lacipirellulaceae bacterium]